ncbi:MAG: VOC family protein [Alphaproteobacteria bacterium]|nr:VOC family protein [Alphaproteobacteria bacterium]MDE2630343.1 VOC family protein [Alphaproteobacteria bacterium]
MKADAHLLFDGSCEKAFKFYERVFGGKIEAMARAAGTPAEKMVSANAIIHARLGVGSTTLMGADAPPDRYKKPQGMAVTVRCDAPEEALRVFKELTEGGEVQMAMAPTFFAHQFGSGTDRFGIPWMVICEKKM